MPDLRTWLHGRLVPAGEVSLLLGAGLDDDVRAAECWRRWVERRALDDVTWEEQRILARVAPRLATIAPSCACRPRVEGLAKADWTRSQLILRASSQAIGLLAEQGIDVMLLKGGALQLAVPQAGVRVIGDLDILVPRARFGDAVRVLYEANWRSKDSMEYASERWRFASGTNLRKAPFGDIDVHHQPLHGAMCPDAVLDRFWRRSGQGVLHGHVVRVPALEDLAVIATVHGVRSRSESPYGFVWLFDLDTVLRAPGIDPEALVRSAEEFGVMPAMQAGVVALHRIAPSEAAARVLECLMRSRAGAGAWAWFVLESLPRRWGKPLRSLLGHAGFGHRIGKERDVVPRIRPMRTLVRDGKALPLEPAAGEFRLRHELELLPPGLIRALLVELRCPPGNVSRRRFDVALNGRIVGRISLRMPKGGDAVRTFRCRVPVAVGGTPVRLSIEALGQFSVLIGASEETAKQARALPFAVGAVRVESGHVS